MRVRLVAALALVVLVLVPVLVVLVVAAAAWTVRRMRRWRWIRMRRLPLDVQRSQACEVLFFFLLFFVFRYNSDCSLVVGFTSQGVTNGLECNAMQLAVLSLLG
jgi:hypothetical protein